MNQARYKLFHKDFDLSIMEKQALLSYKSGKNTNNMILKHYPFSKLRPRKNDLFVI